MREKKIDQGKEKKICESIIKSYQNTSDKKERLQLLQELGRYYKYLKIPKYRNILFLVMENHSDPHVRRSFIKSLSYSKEKDVLEPLIIAMHKDKDPYARFDAARTIGTLKFSESVPALVKTMQNDSFKRIRDEAAYSLGMIGDENAIPFLVEIVKNDDEIFGTAALAISRINGEKGITSLIKLLSINKVENLWYVIYALELLGEKAQKAVPKLSQIAKKHSDYDVRAKAIFSLGHVGGKESIEFLEGELESEEDYYFRSWLALAHGRIFGRDSLGGKELIRLFAFHQMDEEQIMEYQFLCRKFYFDLEEMLNESSKEERTSKLLQKIKNGESNITEFKSYLLWNEHTKQINKEMRFKIALSIASFMNSEGGTIYIGIDDNNNIVGLEKDYSLLDMGKQNNDGFQLYFTSIIKQYIGLKYNDYFSLTFERINDKEICVIDIRKSPEPIYVSDKKNTHFAIRGKGSKEILDIKTAHDYIKLHWGSL